MKTLALDSFTRAYLAAVLWSSTDGESPMDASHSISDFSPEAMESAIDDCAKFQAQAADMIPGGCTRSTRGADCQNEWEQAGHDFWLTRAGHGAGFWDGDWPEHGDALTTLAKLFRAVEPYIGDDDKIYFA
jgi:hypothetical protein